ncbi:MAG: lysophospholipid acyltransferase family protein [Alistipes finegoldii]
MISAVYYIFLVFLCTFFMVLSAVALVVCYPFDKGRRVVHELSRILVRIFFAVPPRWRQRVIGREYVDRKKSYVIVLNHNTVIDIPTLYYIPLNFRWVSKREVFKTPFFRAVPRPARRHLHQPRSRFRSAGADGPRRQTMDFARRFGGRIP